MSFWMYHSSKYENIHCYKRGKILSATIATFAILVMASFIVIPMIYLFSGCAIYMDTFIYMFPVFEVIVFMMFCSHLELFRKFYEGLRMFSEFRKVWEYVIGELNIILWYPRSWR